MSTIKQETYNLLSDKEWSNPKSLKELGYIFYGPIVFNFMCWLKHEVKNGDVVLFNSREGYFLKEIYDIFKKKYDLPKSIYFKTSRRLASTSSFKTKEDIYNSFKLHRYQGLLSDLLKDRFGVDIKIEVDYEIDTLNEMPNLSNYISTILNKSKSTRKEYKKYIDKTLKNYKNVFMVDSGFQGTTQYYLQKTYNLKFKGRYMTYKGNIDLKNTCGFYDFNKCRFKDNIIFFESVFTDRVGTYIDINSNEFINEPSSYNQKVFKSKIQIVKGIKEFVNDMLKNNKCDLKTFNQTTPDYIFDLMCKDGYIQNEKLFDTFFHDNLYTRNSIKKLKRN